MTDLDTALARLDQYLARQLAETSLPGLALALTDRDRTLLTTTHGFADRAARTPVTPDTLFEIGSIGKSFTALALLQLAEAGKLDLHAPVAGYLPWFTVRSDFAPITIHHLLSHTGGIIRGTDHSPGQGYEVWAARQTEAGGPPGERFHYSNLGYKALGLLLAEVTGKPYEETIRERMLAPLEMAASSAAITHDTRNRLAVGYTPFYDDRPFLPTDPLAPATWLETDTADGCLATTAGDLATYLRLLLNRGRLTDGRIVSEESFTLMTTPVIEVAPGASYGYGLMMTEIDGHPCIGHGGGMVGYHAMMLGDLDAGLGVVGPCQWPAAGAERDRPLRAGAAPRGCRQGRVAGDTATLRPLPNPKRGGLRWNLPRRDRVTDLQRRNRPAVPASPGFARCARGDRPRSSRRRSSGLRALPIPLRAG